MLEVRDVSDYLLLLWYDFKIRLLFDREAPGREVSQEPKISCLYFSCGKDFEYLLLSLRSLERLKLNYIKNVYLYIDTKDPLSLKQIDKLTREFPWDIFIRTTKYKLSLGGVGLIVSELLAFKEIITEINQNDYVAKLDSDVLFISDEIFKEVIKGENEAVGQWTGAGFMEGGSCFLKYSLISKIIKSTLYKAIKETYQEPGCELWGCRISRCPEDRALFRLLSQNCDKILLLDFRVPTTKLPFLIDKSNVRISKDTLDGYSIIHFSQWCNLQKKDMEKAWQWLQDTAEALYLPTFFDDFQEWF
jgi:hypothetical protein